jgi:hypothetical protein
MALNDEEKFISPVEEEVVISNSEDDVPEQVFETTTLYDSMTIDGDEMDAGVLEQPVIVYDVESEPMEELEEVVADEIPHDGYYQGPVEVAEMDNLTSNDEVDDLVGNGNTSSNSGGAVTNRLDNNKNTAGFKSDGKDKDVEKSPGVTDTRDERKNKIKTGNNRDRFLAKKNSDAPSLNVSTDVDQSVSEVETTTAYKPEGDVSLGDEDATKEQLDEKQKEIIKSYELHISETKELKGLFGTFK